ncbi:hypothetical protein M422DRAFT_44876 [Sphaerobolus stellatus SS14]|nr:hypothetical protein M422DRAFT_44876 [Sphaerobolus stellatus SS14]
MSAFALRRVLATNPAYRLQAVRLQARSLHITAPALAAKKKRAKTSFNFNIEEEDYFGSLAQEAKAAEREAQRGAKSSRTRKFDALRNSTLGILNRRKLKQPPRQSTILRLAALAENKEELEKVLGVIVAWRNKSRPPSPEIADEFSGRCSRLGYPELALEVFVNHPKYGLDLPFLACARRLLRALSIPRPGYDDDNILPDCLALADLYPVYGFPPASKDVVSCAIIASVVARQVPKAAKTTKEEASESVDMKEAWKEIIAALKSSGKALKSQAASINPKAVHYIRGSLDEVNKTLRDNNEKREWMTQFRVDLRALSGATQTQTQTPEQTQGTSSSWF